MNTVFTLNLSKLVVFQKCFITKKLLSNIMHKFSSPCDTAVSYIGYTTRYEIIRVHEQFKPKLNSKNCNKNPCKLLQKYVLADIRIA